MPFHKRISNIKSKWEVRNGKPFGSELFESEPQSRGPQGRRLDNEVGSGNNRTSHFTSLASHFSLLTSFPGNWKFAIGFTLIELLVVIAIFGLTASLITASYLTFERNQRLKNAALMIKSDIRLIQDKAFSGDKGIGSDSSQSCIDPIPSFPVTLGGWYIRFDKVANNYNIAGDCITVSADEQNFHLRTINLPKDVKINKISYGTTLPDPDNINILFRPLSYEVYINDDASPNFFKDDGKSLEDTLYKNDNLIIELMLSSSNKYQLTIKLTGEVYVEKI